jgi:hypothetical protein
MTGTQEPWRGRQQATSGEAPTNEPIDLDQANAGLNPTRNDIGLASGETALDKPHSFRDDTNRNRSVCVLSAAPTSHVRHSAVL